MANRQPYGPEGFDVPNKQSSLHCPSIKEIEVKRLGKVRRAKLYYEKRKIGKDKRRENFRFLYFRS